MKLLFFLMLIFNQRVAAQPSMQGYWYSHDSTRVYYLYETKGGWEAVLHRTSRPGEHSGARVLAQVKRHRRNRSFTGVIKPVNPGMPLPVTLRLLQNGTVLRLTLRRLFIIPVHLYWYRVSAAS